MILEPDLNGKKVFIVPFGEMMSLFAMIGVRDDEYESLAKTLTSQVTVAMPAKEATPKSAERTVKAQKPIAKKRKAPKAKPAIKVAKTRRSGPTSSSWWTPERREKARKLAVERENKKKRSFKKAAAKAANKN